MPHAVNTFLAVRTIEPRDSAWILFDLLPAPYSLDILSLEAAGATGDTVRYFG